MKTSIALSALALVGVTSLKAKENKQPNFIIILADDQGYEDLGCYGSPLIKTPRIDKMASEGMRFTSFYAQTFSGPSRQALLTGSYPARIARYGNSYTSRGDIRLSLSEVTIAEVLKTSGYATCMIGKWDMAGHSQEKYDVKLAPSAQGFDYSYWTPSSNDKNVNLIRNEQRIETNADLSTLTKKYTDEAINFVAQNKDNPFFIYLAHSMPHVTLAASEDFRGKSKRGLYGDCVEEIDYNVGRILDFLSEQGLDKDTYVIYTSDNGPWWTQGENGGSALPLRGAKMAAWDGAFRVPCIVRAPGRVPKGKTSDLVLSSMDFLPTFAALSGSEMPKDRVIDGVDISDVFLGKQKKLDRCFFFHQHLDLRAVRKGKWKLHLKHEDFNRTPNKMYAAFQNHIAPEDRVMLDVHALYDLDKDIHETENVADKYPEVVAELLKELEWASGDICNYRDGRGANARVDAYTTPKKRR